MKNSIIYIMVVLAAMSCGKRGSMIQDTSEAESRAVECAEALLALDDGVRPDTIAMENAVLKAWVVRSEYQMRGDEASAFAFDRVYRSVIEERNPGLAAVVFSTPDEYEIGADPEEPID